MAERAVRVDDLRESVVSAFLPGTDVHMLMPGVTAFRGDVSDIFRVPESGRPSALFVLDGALTFHHWKVAACRIAVGEYTVMEVHTPPEAVASGEPWLVLVVEFAIGDITSVLFELDEQSWPVTADAPPSLVAEPHLLDSLARLVAVGAEPENGFLLGHAKRELVYRLLTGGQGAAVVGTVANLQGATDVYHINNWIKQNYRQPFSVGDLADASGLSRSAFHRKFKSAVQMGPLQCQKVLRLSEARRLLLDGAVSVADAAVYVGYESISQFTREYKREFGSSPREDVARIHDRLRNTAGDAADEPSD